jgi:hypothetical protein
MHMWHHVTNHLIISNDKDSNSENRIKLRVRDSHVDVNIGRKDAPEGCYRKGGLVSTLPRSKQEQKSYVACQRWLP